MPNNSMRNIKQIMQDARSGQGPFNMTSLEIIRVIRATRMKDTLNDIEALLESAMNGKAVIYFRPVKVVG
jgi:hypothetical protein